MIPTYIVVSEKVDVENGRQAIVQHASTASGASHILKNIKEGVHNVTDQAQDNHKVKDRGICQYEDLSLNTEQRIGSI